MGIPKFFRWISERYPTISQIIMENRIPEFDCLYLDMNGIIHNCTHKDSDLPNVRISEETMFLTMFSYIEHLFSIIKPKKLFFMSVDGVAPRAKMNQQRSRRFRTALDAEKARAKAIKEGIPIPKEDPFDSNCITPGTEFMTKLSKQLVYFIHKKISEDKDWQGVEVIFSGHDVPGEGEHKIMEYIRIAKSLPNYNPNRTHCLYGLDADLIMLGLLSHDPHFCLLREEVTFGRQSKRRPTELENQRFFLMHLCMVREYLELEFQSLTTPGLLSFPFNMERIIDDFILMAFFIGNDFLPNIPNFYINEGALARMFDAYRNILPSLDGYINEAGKININRLAVLIDELAKFEISIFESENADADWLPSKRTNPSDVKYLCATSTEDTSDPIKLTSRQNVFLNYVKAYIEKCQRQNDWVETLTLDFDLSLSERNFLTKLFDELAIDWKSIPNKDGNRVFKIGYLLNNHASRDILEHPAALKKMQNSVFRAYGKGEVDENDGTSSDETKVNYDKNVYDEKFWQWRNQYYESKFGWSLNNRENVVKLAESYVQGLQWVLYYYYRGVKSWPWYFAYHYAPMISEIREGLHAKMEFEIGEPLLPFQQLMGVLPDRSKSIVPKAYQSLFSDANSPILDFYPHEFELDMDSKKSEWEAVIKIPFIDEKRLIKAMEPRVNLLTDEEKSRNRFGPPLHFVYKHDVNFVYWPPFPGSFPPIMSCHCVESELKFLGMDARGPTVGLLKGVKLGVQALAGFPTLKTLPFRGDVVKHGVSVFQMDSRNESLVITLTKSKEHGKLYETLERLGKVVYVGYPFLQEAMVMKVSDENYDYTLDVVGSELTKDADRMDFIKVTQHTPKTIEQFRKAALQLESRYSKKYGILIGKVERIVHVELLRGLRRNEDGSLTKEYGVLPNIDTEYASQTILDRVYSPDNRYLARQALPFAEEFKPGTRAFFLGEKAYGYPLLVLSVKDDAASVWLLYSPMKERNFGRTIAEKARKKEVYQTSTAVSRMFKVTPLVLSKLTSSYFVMLENGSRVNLGLNLKFEAKQQKVLEYTRKREMGWEYSVKAIQLIGSFIATFPDFVEGILRNSRMEVLEDKHFYAKGVAEARFKEISTWLKELEVNKLERVPLQTEMLQREYVREIESEVEGMLEKEEQAVPIKVEKVKREQLLNPCDAQNRLGEQKFQLGDRVRYVLDSGSVPIGQQGTIIGKAVTSHNVMLDVVFDTTFMSGSTLGERCSPYRGATVSSNSVLNLTNRQIVVASRNSEEIFINRKFKGRKKNGKAELKHEG